MQITCNATLSVPLTLVYHYILTIKPNMFLDMLLQQASASSPLEINEEGRKQEPAAVLEQEKGCPRCVMT